MKWLRYGWYVLRHKWFVLAECFKIGLFWRGLTHDLSKLLPSEYLPYADFFYGKKAKQVRDETGYYKPTDTGHVGFDFAWLLHQKRNDHHWQWWVLPEDDGGEKVLPMSDAAVREMVCDWRGAGRAQGTPDTLAWYYKNKDKMRLHDASRNAVETLIGFREWSRGLTDAYQDRCEGCSGASIKDGRPPYVQPQEWPLYLAGYAHFDGRSTDD